MKKLSFKEIQKGVIRGLRKHSPEILTGIGIAGMIFTTVEAVRVTPKALRLIDQKEIEDNKRLTPVEVVKTTWKCYVPVVITGALSTACLIGASSVNLRRNAALATAYSLSETALKEYQEKTLEVAGEKKEQEIRNAIAKEQLAKVPLDEARIFDTGNGDQLCFDPLSGRYFRSDPDGFIRKCETILNKRLRDEVTLSMNEYFEELGLPTVDRSVGDSLGWDINEGRGYIDLDFEWILDPPDREGVKCCVIGHRNPPKYHW